MAEEMDEETRKLLKAFAEEDAKARNNFKRSSSEIEQNDKLQIPPLKKKKPEIEEPKPELVHSPKRSADDAPPLLFPPPIKKRKPSPKMELKEDLGAEMDNFASIDADEETFKLIRQMKEEEKRASGVDEASLALIKQLQEEDNQIQEKRKAQEELSLQTISEIKNQHLGRGICSEKFNCLYCMDDIEPFQGVTLDCKCNMCLECFKNYGEIHCKNSQVMVCQNCKVQVSASRLSLVLSDEDLNRYVQIEQIHLGKVTKLFQCLTPDCKNAVALDAAVAESVLLTIDNLNTMDPKDFQKIPGVGPHYAKIIQQHRPFQSFQDLTRYGIRPHTQKLMQTYRHKSSESIAVSRWHCKECETTYCMRCKVKYHEDMTCADYEREEMWKNAEPEMKELVTKGLLHRCEKCGTLISKTAGCKFMNCAQCKTPFCWECKKVLKKDHENHKCHVKGYGGNKAVNIPKMKVQGNNRKKPRKPKPKKRGKKRKRNW